MEQLERSKPAVLARRLEKVIGGVPPLFVYFCSKGWFGRLRLPCELQEARCLQGISCCSAINFFTSFLQAGHLCAAVQALLVLDEIIKLTDDNTGYATYYVVKGNFPVTTDLQTITTFKSCRADKHAHARDTCNWKL